MDSCSEVVDSSSEGVDTFSTGASKRRPDEASHIPNLRRSGAPARWIQAQRVDSC